MPKDDVQLVYKALKRGRNLQMIASGLFVIIGVVVYFQWNDLPEPAIYLVKTISIFIIGVGLLLFIRSLKLLNLKNSIVIKLMEEYPGQVVWVYHHVVQNMPFGIKVFNMTSIYFNLLDGKQEHFRVSNNDAEKVMNALRHYFPHATFGHSVEKEQLYRASPELLLRYDEDEDDELSYFR